VKPKLQRIEKKYAGDVTFKQVNFKVEEELCYQQRVINFPTVIFYFPGIGRVSQAVLTAATTDKTVSSTLDHLLGARDLYERLSSEAIAPLVQYAELVGALHGLAEFTESREQITSAVKELTRMTKTTGSDLARRCINRAIDDLQEELDSSSESSVATGFASLVDPKKESARLRSLIESDAQRLAELESLFSSLDDDGDGTLELGKKGGSLETAVFSLQPERSAATNQLLERIESCLTAGGDAQSRILASLGRSIKVEKARFLSIMMDKDVQDFATGKAALLPAFEMLDSAGEGAISQAQLVRVVDHFCTARPDTYGCEIDDRSERLADAFTAFANADEKLDHDGFVEMVTGRSSAFVSMDQFDGVVEPTALGEEDEAKQLAADPSRDLGAIYGDLMGERECFGEAKTGEGDEDYACDAWHYGEDPTQPKKDLMNADQAKVEMMRLAGENAAAERAAKEAQMAAFLAKAEGYTPPAPPPKTTATGMPVDDLMGERECFGEAKTGEGDEDYACDAWHYGEDPTQPKKDLMNADQSKVEMMRLAGENAAAERAAKEAQMAAFLAKAEGYTPPAPPPKTTATGMPVDDLMGERECFGEAKTGEGDEDYACDAWFYGEDPTQPKKELLGADQAKVEEMRLAGEKAKAEREEKEAQMAAFLAKTKAAAPPAPPPPMAGVVQPMTAVQHTAAPRAPIEIDDNMGEREACIEESCDAWNYGANPTKPKKDLMNADAGKVEMMRAAGEKAAAERGSKEEQLAVFLARAQERVAVERAQAERGALQKEKELQLLRAANEEKLARIARSREEKKKKRR